uniref:Response regulator transcription factor n=1 Tax=Thermocrinis ruber TaxID=75906 RepID=A0A7C5SYX3_9AQUI
MKVLLVEDETDLAIPISRFLSSAGWDCTVAKNLSSALEFLEREVFDMCVLDLFLGKEDGTKLIPVLSDKNIPIIVLTVVDDVSVKVKCLRMGADDYMVKPFNPEELLVRMEAVLRRVKNISKSRTIVYEDMEIDPFSMTVRVKGEILPLPKKQVMILIKLLENVGKVTSYETLFSYAWSSYEDASIDALRTHVYNLRKILRNYGFDIVSYPGIGYTLKYENSKESV